MFQGVTLTELKEAKKTSSLSLQDRDTEEGGPLDDRSCLTKGFADDSRVRISLTESTQSCLKWSKTDEVSKRT